MKLKLKTKTKTICKKEIKEPIHLLEGNMKQVEVGEIGMKLEDDTTNGHLDKHQ
jgi:hypothetical protein